MTAKVILSKIAPHYPSYIVARNKYFWAMVDAKTNFSQRAWFIFFNLVGGGGMDMVFQGGVEDTIRGAVGTGVVQVDR